MLYSEVSSHIQIEVDPAFVPEQSSPEQGFFFFSYRIKISNHGTTSAQLLRRHWIIKDGAGDVREVHGDGVVGEQPLIRPGESFEYTSFCPLTTPTGNMRGSYEFVDEAGARFTARIPLFFLRDLRAQGAAPESILTH